MTGLIPVSWGNFLNGTWLTPPHADTVGRWDAREHGGADPEVKPTCLQDFRHALEAKGQAR